MKKLSLTPSEPRTLRERAENATTIVFSKLKSYVAMLHTRLQKQDGNSKAIETLRNDVIAEMGIPFSREVAGSVERAIFQSWVQGKPMYEGEPEYFSTEPQYEEPVVGKMATNTVPPLWSEALRYLGSCEYVLDKQLFGSCERHLATLPDDQKEGYMPAYVAETINDIGKADSVFGKWLTTQISGRGTHESMRGCGPVNTPQSRFWFVFKRKFKVSKKAKLFFQVCLCLEYGLQGTRGVDNWAKKVLAEDDVSDKKNGIKAISYAKAWRDICKSGKTNRGVEFDAHTSGLVHILMEWGQYSMYEIDCYHSKWRKLHFRMVAKLKSRCPFMATWSIKEILIWAKSCTTVGQYGGGKKAITGQILDIKWDHSKNCWKIPNEGLVVPKPFEKLLAGIEDPQEAVKLFEKKVGSPYATHFKSCFPMIPLIVERLTTWAGGSVPEDRVVGIGGWQCPILDYRELDTKKHGISFVDDEGLKHGCGVSTLVESSYTDVLAKLIHNLDSFNMFSFVLKCKEKNIPCRAIHDAVVIPIAYLEWAMKTFSHCFLETHKQSNLPFDVTTLWKEQGDWEPWKHDHTPMVVGL